MALIPPFGAIFGVSPIGLTDWLVVLGLSIVPTLVAEGFKLWDNRCEFKAFRARLVKHNLDEDRWCS